ncbi:hypothetical protein KP509_08G068600 [Ceratopteris richardii]|nr:hypothetical protein KP509_08G068600 [Ceratopteris richardii]KAH7431826.1 hypothetical protein KP509_08G068600 [Ceratopteris richardii]
MEKKVEEPVHLHLHQVPGGPDGFEFVAKFCYGVRLELTAVNVIPICCIAEYLEMTEEFGEGNLIAAAEGFLNHVVLRNWKECIKALRSSETVFLEAEELGVINQCVDALTLKACTNPSIVGWPMPYSSMQSPGGSLLWNGINTGAKPRRSRSDWWYEDVSRLSLPLYRRVIEGVKHRGLKPESVAGALMHFASRYLPALTKLQTSKDGNARFGPIGLAVTLSESEQKAILETIDNLLPMQKALVPSKFLARLLRSAIILNASLDCRSNIERRIGLQLDETSLEDLLLPNLTYNMETLYDIDCVQRILDHFLLFDHSIESSLSTKSDDENLPIANSPPLSPIMMVARLMDSYLGEVAPDVNLKLLKFKSLAEALPGYARVSDDGLYRAIDIYLKAHPWLKEEEKEQLCQLMDCQKLSLEACAHAAQNERLPLRAVVRVLFFEQLQLRTAIASCFMVSDNSRPLQHPSVTDAIPSAAALMRGEGWANAVRDNQALRVDMDNMKVRVNNLEKECSGMREELEKIGKIRGHWNMVSRALGNRFKSHICRTRNSATVQDQTRLAGTSHGLPSVKSRQSLHRRSSSLS